MSETRGDINRERLRQGIASGEFTERVLGESYFGALRALNDRLFTDQEGTFTPGWRDKDVAVGPYFPPHYENVQALLEQLGEKVGVVEKSVALKGDPQEMEKLAAWTMLMVLRIHPRLDGNGRLSEAVGEQLIPGKRLLGVPFDGWAGVERASMADMMEKVSQVSGQPIPHLLNMLNENFGSPNQDELNKTMQDFYRYDGKDWVTDVIRADIDSLSVNDQGSLVPGGALFSKALMGMSTFVHEAPVKPSPRQGLIRRVIQRFVT